MLFRRLFLFVVAVLLLAITLPASAHDLPMGSSWWAFGSNSIVGYIDFKPNLFSEIKGIKEGHYDLYALSSEQLQQIATDLIQPYIDKKLSITVDGKTYPIKVNKLAKNANNLFTIRLSADNVSFAKSENSVKIAYSLLSDETGNEHVNLAYGYVTDAAGDALQKVFDYSQPEFRTTFDSSNHVWEFSIKGPANVAAAEPKTGSPVASAGSEGTKSPAAKKSAVHDKPAPVPVLKAVPEQQAAGSKPVVSPTPALPTPSPGRTSPSIPQSAVKSYAWATICQFVPLGIEHILTGYDHIAFLLAVIVIGLSVKEVLKVITAFTIAHSVTLLLAATQVIQLNSRFVESVIAFSICYVAIENLYKKKVQYRWLITFGFGLIHGFGFASALQELLVNKSSLLLSVVSFNAGVEMGQLSIFFVLFPILYVLKKQTQFRIVTVSASAGIFLIAFTWLMERLFNFKLLWF